MNNLETNALRIAELMGYNVDNVDFKIASKGLFTKYDYLMPIVFECNKSNVDYPININPHQIKAYPRDALDIYSYSTEPEFIEAIQECVIKYLELKNDNSRV